MVYYSIIIIIYLNGDKMKDFETICVAPGVQIVSAPANRFKTNEISIGFCTPLSAETASRNALCANLLARTTKKYPTLSEFNKKLAMLYGASVTCSVTKLGENQLLTLNASSLDDRFSFENDKISVDAFNLLMSMVFDANIDENGFFYPQDVDREKRLLAEKIESEENEKRIYSLRRLEQIMFDGEPYAVNRYGSVDAVKSVTADDLKSALEYFKTNAKIQITVVGNADVNAIADSAKQYFSIINRDYIAPQKAVFVPTADRVNTAEERIDVKQGKLVLGFRVNRQSDFKPVPEMLAFSDVFGGGPYSKLFLNVREKLSLCYYCSAKYDRRKSNLIIQCGCEEENMDKAVEEILNQLSDIKNGNFDDTFTSSKIALADALNGVYDDSLTLSSWYLTQIADDEIISPSDSASNIAAVTKQQVQDCAGLLTLDTVYKLVGNKEGE